MFRLSVILLLVTSLLTQSMSKGLIVLSYFTNKAAYERYCVNKARPQLHCDGKCQVAKKIKAEEERDQKDPLKSGGFSEQVLINQNHFVYITPVYTAGTMSPKLCPASIGNVRHYARSLFHPPDMA